MHKALCAIGIVGLCAGSAFLGALSLMLVMGRTPEESHEAIDVVAEAWGIHDKA